MNGFFSKFNLREALGTTSAPAETEPQKKGGSFSNNAVMITSSNAALNIAAFQRAIVLRANTMSQLLWKYQKMDSMGGNYIDDNRGPGRNINYLFQTRPNELMSAPVFWRQAMMNVDLQGNAVIYIDRDVTGEVRALYNCQMASVNPIDLNYTISWVGLGGLFTKTVPHTDVIHFRGVLSRDNSLNGLSLITYGMKTLSLAATNDKLVQENAAKGGRIKLLVQEEKSQGFGLGRASKKELEKITSQLNRDVYNEDVVLMSNVANVTPISQNMQQQEIQLTRNFSVRETSRITGVPPILLMDDSNSSYKSPEAATQEFLLRTISPIQREWEAEVNSKLLGREGMPAHRFHLCEKPLLRLDPTGSANVAKIHLETGIKTVNELRADHDMPRVEGGDKALVSTNLQEVSNMKVNATPSAQEGGET